MAFPSSTCPLWNTFTFDLPLAFRSSDHLFTEPPAEDGALLVGCLVMTDLIVTKQELMAVLDGLRERWRPGLRLGHIDIQLPGHGIRRIRLGPFTKVLLLRLTQMPGAEEALRDYLAWASTYLDEELPTDRRAAVDRLMQIVQARVRWSLPGGAADRVLLLRNGRTPMPAGYRRPQRTVSRYDAEATDSVARLAKVQNAIGEADRKGLGDHACRRHVAETVTLWSDLSELEELVRSLVLKWVSEEKDPHTILAYSSMAKGMFAYLQSLGTTIEDMPAVSWLDYYSALPPTDRQQSKRAAVLNDLRDLIGHLTHGGRPFSRPIGYARSPRPEELPEVEQLIRQQTHLPRIVVDSAVTMLHSALRYGLRSDELVTLTAARVLRKDEDLVAIRRSPTFSGKSFAAYRFLAPEGTDVQPAATKVGVFVTDSLNKRTIDEAAALLHWALGRSGAVTHGLRTRALSDALGRRFLPGAERAALDDAALLNAEATVAIFAGHAGPGIVSSSYYDAQDRERRAWADEIIAADLERLKHVGFSQGCDGLIARVAGVTPAAVRKRRSRSGRRHVELLNTFIPEAYRDENPEGLAAQHTAPDASSEDDHLLRTLAYLASRLGGTNVRDAIAASRISGAMQGSVEHALRVAQLSRCKWSLQTRKREPLPALAAAALPLLQNLPSAASPEQIAAMGSALGKGGVICVFDLKHLSALPPLAGLIPLVRLTVLFDAAREHIADVHAACRSLGPIEALAKPGTALSIQCAWRHRTPPKVLVSRALYLACAGWWALNVVGAQDE